MGHKFKYSTCPGSIAVKMARRHRGYEKEVKVAHLDIEDRSQHKGRYFLIKVWGDVTKTL